MNAQVFVKNAALASVLTLSVALSTTACSSSAGGGASSREFADPAAAASYWLSAVQAGDYDKACEAMSPGAVSDALTAADTCGSGLEIALEWYGDSEDYASLLVRGAPSSVEATQCGGLEVGKTCWADFVWDASDESGAYAVDKLLVRSPNGFQVSMLGNEGETGYANPQAGVEVQQDGGLFPTARAGE